MDLDGPACSDLSVVHAGNTRIMCIIFGNERNMIFMETGMVLPQIRYITLFVGVPFIVTYTELLNNVTKI